MSDGGASSALYPAQRLDVAREAAARAGLDALLICPGADLRYLTGYDALPLERLTCLVLPVEGRPCLLVPALEEPAAAASPAGASGLELVAWNETDDPYAIAASRLPAVERVGLDNHMWVEKAAEFHRVLPNAQQDLAGAVISELRLRKTAAEIEALRLAGAAIDRVHARMGQWLRAGRTEREVGRDIADAIIAEGHTRVDFVIVGAGPNGASPHHEVSDRVIEPGDAVVVDIGGTTREGYCSDSTRVYAVGEPPAPFREMYEVLLAAQQAQVEAVRPGITAQELDAVGRDLIAKAGFGDRFIHRTGHGIGLDVHEDPYIVGGNTLAVEAGMAFSIEPGIYLPGRWGARIEDIVVVTETGVESVNNRPHELVSV